MPKYLAVVATVSEWLFKALEGDVRVFHFPPGRNPRVRYLEKGDPVLVYLYDRRVFAAEFVIVNVDHVDGKTFSEKYARFAVEVGKARFPRKGERCWVIEFADFRVYPVWVSPVDVGADKLGLLGFFRLLTYDKYEWLLRNVREKASEEVEYTHKKLQDVLVELGSIFNYISRMNYKDPHGLYIYDVVWLEDEGLPPVRVFEVQKSGSLDVALSRLKHAYNLWGARLYLVVVQVHDAVRASRLVQPYLRGAFHNLRNKLTIITAQQLMELYRDISSHKELVRELTGEYKLVISSEY